MGAAGDVAGALRLPVPGLNVQRVSVLTGRKNKKARKLLCDLGFKFVGVAKRGLDGNEDAFIFELLKENCKWLKDRDNGTISTTSSAAARSVQDCRRRPAIERPDRDRQLRIWLTPTPRARPARPLTRRVARCRPSRCRTDRPRKSRATTKPRRSRAEQKHLRPAMRSSARTSARSGVDQSAGSESFLAGRLTSQGLRSIRTASTNSAPAQNSRCATAWRRRMRAILRQSKRD